MKVTEPEAPLFPTTGVHLLVFLREGLKTHALRPGRVTIVGRAEECDVSIDAPSISRRHFAIHPGPPYAVEDLGGANGTKVRGRRLEPQVPVAVEMGTLVECGGVFFTLRQGNLPANRDRAWAPGAVNPSAIDAVASDTVILDAAMARIHELVGMVAKSSIPVLIVGETGVGKEVVSTAIHTRSRRAGGPFVRINCAALPEALLESELFGHERGAFTGAIAAKPGLIEAAHRGTLFLDEIGEMPSATQAKLLRVLESGELTRLGSLKPREVDVRFVAATNRSLPELLASGAFRHDLYFRLNGITIPLPALRERPLEIPALARFFLERAARRSERAVPHLSDDAIAALMAHPWPGNVRELKNVVERALALSTGAALSREHIVIDDYARISVPPLAAPLPATQNAASGGRLLRMDAETERNVIVQALEQAGGNQSKASEILGISRRTLVNRLNEHGLDRPRKRTT